MAGRELPKVCEITAAKRPDVASELADVFGNVQLRERIAMTNAAQAWGGLRQCRPKILVVDNIPENLEVMEALLCGMEASIICVGSGPEALARFDMDKFAVVLLDVAMPEMDGFQVARAIRSNPTTAETPLIFVTAYPKGEFEVQEGYHLGAVDFLIKPIDHTLLRSKIRAFLNVHNALQERRTTHRI
jgi:CheY-like chemotaxis protein